MRFNSVFEWVSRLAGSGRKGEQLRLLKQQRYLLHQGLETSAEVMGTSLTDDKVGSLLPVRLWLKLRKTDGSFIYTHTQTLVPLNHIPGKGQRLRIKYLPENLSHILIL